MRAIARHLGQPAGAAETPLIRQAIDPALPGAEAATAKKLFGLGDPGREQTAGHCLKISCRHTHPAFTGRSPWRNNFTHLFFTSNFRQEAILLSPPPPLPSPRSELFQKSRKKRKERTPFSHFFPPAPAKQISW
jgi:hypothetical protein